MAFTIKLIQNDFIRRVSFPSRPRWADLAARIQQLFAIPAEFAGVSYQDSDGDIVTLSSQEELEEYYTSFAHGSTIKFTVVDLSALRHDDKTLPDTPTSRNTFGGPNIIYDVDQDWQLPIGEPYGRFDLGREGSLHAFVESVDSTSNLSRAPEGGERLASRGPHDAKSQDLDAKVSPDDVSSTASVLGNNDGPSKLPIHVAVHGLSRMPSDTFGPQPGVGVSTPVGEFSPPLFSTPRAGVADANRNPSIDVPVFSHPDVSLSDAPDPPSPQIRADDFPPPDPSLTSDITSLLNALGVALQSHPELTNSLSNIVSNVRNGTYWAVHRETVAQAADDIRRASLHAQTELGNAAQDLQRTVEVESSRRVAEAIENILRPFTEAVQERSNPVSTIPPLATPDAPDEFQRAVPLQQAAPSPHERPLPADTEGKAPIVPPWSVFKPYVAPPSRHLGSVPAINTQNSTNQSNDVSFYAASPVSQTTRPRQKASDLKASLEAAKENYKREKARYRREREERRQTRRTHDDSTEEIGHGMDTLNHNSRPTLPATPLTLESTSQMTTPRTPRQIISNARGGFPQMEIVELPSPKARRHGSQSQAMRNVVEKLETMGFSSDAYPGISSAIDARLPLEQEISTEKENDVVSGVIEELLTEPAAPKGPVASGSGTRQADFWL